MKARTIASDLGWPEGPSVLDDGRIVFVETFKSRVSVYSADSGVTEYAFTGGGPNATCLGDDGYVYVTQNGGSIAGFEADAAAPPSIQRIAPGGGAVEIVVTEVAGYALRAPNDLAFGPDGRLYFTDPGEFAFVNAKDRGRIFALEPDGTGELLIEMDPTYPNGIVVEPDGSVVWVESLSRLVRRRRPDGAIELICTLPEGHLPDGLALAEDGRLFICVTEAGGLDVVSSDGETIEFVPLGLLMTNAAFAGQTLYVTDANQSGHDTAKITGVVWQAELDDAKGQDLFRGRIDPQRD